MMIMMMRIEDDHDELDDEDDLDYDTLPFPFSQR